MSSSLMVNVSKLTDCDYEGIIQSLITNVDIVWVNHLALDINDNIMVKKISELHDAGLVKFWDFETSRDSYTKSSRIITREEYTESKNSIEKMMANKDLDPTSINNTITYDIQERNMLFNLMMARYCGAESIIQRNNVRKMVKSGNEDPLQKYAEYLFNETSIYSVSGLSTADIIELRRYSSSFRKTIQHKIDSQLINGDIPASVIREDCRELSKAYCEEINNRIKGQTTSEGTAAGIIMDMLSFVVNPVTIYNIGQKLWDAVFNRDKRGFVMYLTTLKRLT